MFPPPQIRLWQAAAHASGGHVFSFDFNAGQGQYFWQSGASIPCAADHTTPYLSIDLRSGPVRVGPAFAAGTGRRSSAHAGRGGESGCFFYFPFSNIRVMSQVIKTLNRGSIPCSRLPLSQRRLSHRFCRAASAQAVTRQATVPPSVRLAARPQVPLLPMPRVAAPPKARFWARSWAVCPAAFPVCQPAIDPARRVTGAQNDCNQQRPSKARPWVVFSYVPRPGHLGEMTPCFKKS